MRLCASEAHSDPLRTAARSASSCVSPHGLSRIRKRFCRGINPHSGDTTAHRCPCVCLSSGLENVNILAPTEETLRISCCWNTRFPQPLMHTPCCCGRRILSIREQLDRINTECLFSLKEFAQGESSQRQRRGVVRWKPPDASTWQRGAAAA